MARKKTIITAALTGTLTPLSANAPETPEAIGEAAYEAWKHGAAMVHLHMRDDNRIGTMDINKFRETIYNIRKHKDCDVIINCTSSGDPKVSDDSPEGNAKRMEHLGNLDGIEIGTYDAGTFNWLPDKVFHNSPQFLDDLGNLYLKRGIKPEIEAFDMGMLSNVEHFLKKGSLVKPLHFTLVMGVKGAMDATVENLVYLQRHLPEGSTWSATGIGKNQMAIMYAALALGGHIRVGMEDNIIFGFDENGEKIPATNNMQIDRAVQAIKTFGNDVATPAEAREILSLPPLDIEATCKKLGID